MNFLLRQSGEEKNMKEAVLQPASPPLAGGDKGEGETKKLKNFHPLSHPHLYSGGQALPPIKGEGSLGLSDNLEASLSWG